MSPSLSFLKSATPPPASAAVSDAASPAPPPPSSVPPTTAGLSTTLTLQQHRFLTSTIRTLKKMKDASPFLRPVDPVALNIPHYPSIIKHPMDISTVERKLASSNPQKLDPNPNNPRYFNVDEFVADVRLIFANCVTFNGPDHAIRIWVNGWKKYLTTDKTHPGCSRGVKLTLLPPPPPPPPPVSVPVPVPPAKKTTAARRPSTSIPVIRRNDQNEAVGRPKREIHPPPPKDLPYAEPAKKSKKGKRVKDDGTAEQLRFCSKVLTDLHKKQYYNIAHPFYEPVDWVKLEIPSYPKVIKKPMDLSTMRKKLENNDYSTATKFLEDFRLMIRNCFNFNPAGTPVNQAGIELQRVFDDKWKSLPPLHLVEPSDDEEEEDEEELLRQRTIAEMESQIETMRENLDALKSKPVKEKKKKEKERPVIASTSKAPPKPSKPSTKKASTKKKPLPDDDVLTFDQKKDLSESIGKLDGSKLEKVIQIIHEGVPEIRDSTEEIELEIDLLPAAVLTKLYNYVIRPIRQQNAPKRGGRSGKGTGTGGLKRKSMDEDLEAEKIRQLEERMALFEKKEGGAASLPTHREVESEQSSDSSSDDSSGSDSD
ncbi:Bromodomain-containing protein [Cyathus striatus]|nr:Bromodomain-containing protein [Cyathus striatus]